MNYVFDGKYFISYKLAIKYPVGRALTSDWSANSFIMVVYEEIF